MADRTPKKVVSKPSVHVCRCCNDNVLERNHSIDLYGPKATKESVLALLERLTGFKCDINDGLSSKVCRSSYEKIMKIKKFSDIFLRSTKQQQSLIRFKRCKTQGDSPSRKPVSGSPGKSDFILIIIPIIYLLFVVMFCIWHGFFHSVLFANFCSSVNPGENNG